MRGIGHQVHTSRLRCCNYGAHQLMKQLMENIDMRAAGDWQLASAERYFWQARERRPGNVIRSKSARISVLPSRSFSVRASVNRPRRGRRSDGRLRFDRRRLGASAIRDGAGAASHRCDKGSGHERQNRERSEVTDEEGKREKSKEAIFKALMDSPSADLPPKYQSLGGVYISNHRVSAVPAARGQIW